MERMTAMHALLGDQGRPQVDLTVWAPFGQRISKPVKMRSVTIVFADGRWMPIGNGPSTFARRGQSDHVYRLGARMFGAMSSSPTRAET